MSAEAPVRSASAAGPDPLPEAASLLLDAVRFSLALLVVVGHMTLPWFSAGWPSLLGWANLAVPCFFVLSGLMIRYVTTTREREARRYWVSRAARVYSVVLPAILLTAVADMISRRADPALYRVVAGRVNWSALPAHLAAHLLFTTQTWGHAVLLLSNLPLWSLGYEVPYYVLFGLGLFLRGWRRSLALGVAAVAWGPQVLFLLPVWYLGCWVYDGWQWLRAPGRDAAARLGTAGGCAAVLGVLLVPRDGLRLFTVVRLLPTPLVVLHQAAQRATFFSYAAGLCAAAALLPALMASDALRLPKDTRWARGVRLVADSTFVLYLIHYPLLLLARSLRLYRVDHTGDKLAVIAAVVMLAVLLAVPIDRLKQAMRRGLMRLSGGAATGTKKM